MSESVYLDHNAMAQVRPQARQAVQAALDLDGNGSSVHARGRAARSMIEAARSSVAALCGAPDEAVTFTSGGTEANNLILRGCERPRLLISAVEHPSVREAREDAVIIPVDGDGIVDVGALEGMLRGSDVPTLVSVMYANNETGVIQPVARVAEVARKHGALMHCDAIQAAGKIPLDVATLGVHFLSVSGHKIGAPAGCGAVINVEGLALQPMMRGGGQERRVRSGTENLIGIAGFGAAADAARQQGPGEMARLRVWRDALENKATQRMGGLVIAGASATRLDNTSYMMVPGMEGAMQVMALDLAGVAISAGSACSSGKAKASSVLAAMGYDDALANCGIRISLGWSSAQDDIERFFNAWIALYDRTISNAA